MEGKTVAEQFKEVKPINDKMYKTNLEALKKRYPDYAEKLGLVDIYVRYRTFRTGKSQSINLYDVEKNDFYYNMENPLQDAADSIEQLKLINVKLAVIFGLGLSYELDYFSRTILPKNGTRGVVLVEKEWEIFKLTLHFVNLTEIFLNPRVLLIVGEEHARVFPLFEDFVTKNNELLYYFKSIKFIYHSKNFTWYKDYYIKMIRTFKDMMQYILKYYGNDPHDSLIGVENMMDNLDIILNNPGINLLYEKFKGKPAVIVSTGPSLNKNKHLLKGLEDKALLIAPDASLKIMMEMGVKPHLVTSLERQGPVDKLLEGFSEEEVNDVYFAAAPVIKRKVYDVFPAPRVIVYRNFDHFKWLGVDKGILQIKQSSGNMAFKIADALGCNPIILIGQDLAYSRDGDTHASGNALGKKQKFNASDLEVMGNDGTPIRTNSIWDGFRKGYEIDVNETDKTVINCTEGGAYIRGTEIMKFSEAIEQYVQDVISPLEIIQLNLSKFSSENSKKDKDHLGELFVKTDADLVFIKSKALEGTKLIDENRAFLEKNISGEIVDEEKVTGIFNEIVGIRKEIFSVQPTFQLYLMHIIQAYNIKFENDIHAFFDQYQKRNEVYAAIALENYKWFTVFSDIVELSRKALKIGADRGEISIAI